MLLELARVVQKQQVYPEGHPALDDGGRQAAERAEEALAAVGRSELRISVGRDRLAVEGTGRSSRENGLCRSLARALHRRHVATLTIRPGVPASEMRELARWLTSDVDGDRAAAGEEDGTPPEASPEGVPEPPKLGHLAVESLPYDALRLRRGDDRPPEPDPGTEQIWRELAAAAHGAGDAGGLAEEELDPGAVGDSLAARIGERGVPERVRGLVGRVLRRAEPPPGGGVDGRSEFAGRLDEVLGGLGDDELARLLVGDDATEEEVRGLILDAAPHLTPENLERLVRIADDHQYLEISDWLLRVLGKLVEHSRSGSPVARSAGGRRAREQVRELVLGYEGEAPHAARYAAALRRMSRPGASAGRYPGRALPPVSAERLLLTGLELDCEAVPVREAWEEHREALPLPELVTWLDRAPDGEQTAWLRAEVVEGGDPIRRLLAEEPPATEATERAIEWTDAAAAQLLDAMAEDDRRGVRRFAFDRLAELGEAARDEAVPRLSDDRWYVRRNVLALLGRVDSPPFDLPLDTHLRDPHEAVRREAIRLGLRDPEWRDRALEAALQEENRRTITIGLGAALEGGFPERLVGRIVEIAKDESRDAGVRRRAARALGRLERPAARDALLDLARRRPWPFFWTYAVRSPSPVVREAVAALARGWSPDPEARELLEQARASEDSELRSAAEAP